MDSSLRLVTEQFPRLQDRVVRLFEVDEVFREMCEDHEACIHAIARHVEREALCREYAALRLRLEAELLRYVEEDGLRRPAESPGSATGRGPRRRKS